MRKTLLILAAAAPLAVLAGLALPVSAETSNGACGSGQAAAAGPIDLEAIPTKPVDGTQLAQVQGIAGCGEEDDHFGRGDDDGERHAGINEHEGLEDRDD